MIAGKYNIVVYKNRDYYQTFKFDITINTSIFYAAVDKREIDVNFTITHIGSDTIALSLSKELINTFEVGTYKWDLKMVTDGLHKQVVEGTFEVKNSVTE